MWYLKLNKLFFVIKVAVVFSCLSFSVKSLGQVTHAYVNNMRSANASQFLIAQSVEGEQGEYRIFNDADNQYTNTLWKGYGLMSSLGLEMFKFVQFRAAHTFINMSERTTSLESMQGSRFSAEVRLIFIAPIVNLEAAAGAQASRNTYQSHLNKLDYNGNGTYYSLGLSHYLSAKISLFSNYRALAERFARGSGSNPTAPRNIDANSRSLGFGFGLWL